MFSKITSTLPFLTLILFLSLSANAQKIEYVKTNSAKESLQIAQGLVNKGKLKKAKRQIQHCIKIKPNFAVAYRVLGNINLELSLHEKAVEAFEKSFELDDKISRAAYFECAKAYMHLYKIDLAQFHLTKYEQMKGTRYANAKLESALEIIYDDELEFMKSNVAFLNEIDFDNAVAETVHLGKTINSSYDEYLPTITSDGNYLVFTRKINNQDENIFFSALQDGQWTPPRQMNDRINSEFNEGMAKFRTDGKAFYFSACERPGAMGGCDVYLAVLENGNVHHVERLQGYINSDFWDSQPSVTCDGKTIYFASTREGGHGGSDIWVSHLRKNGQWGQPVNLGPDVNTPRDEEAPFIATDGKTLYFTSTGLPGQGDGDLFMTQRAGKNRWTTPKNMGYPINSPTKEIGLYVQGDGKTAYFASARPGGQGMLDLYSVELPLHLRPDPMVHIDARIFDAETEEPISTEVKILRNDETYYAKSDKEGKFFTCLPGNKGYSFLIEDHRFENFVQANFLPAQDNALPLLVKIPLVSKKKAVVQSIIPKESMEKRVQFFFGFGSSDLTDETYYELDDLVQMLNKDPDWEIEIVGYTDNVGDINFNRKLSKERAEHIAGYLIEKGIPETKVIKKEGRGALSTKGAMNEDDQKMNRRVDVVLRK